jgi:glycerophosphoryl diester phosphodiesterase
MKSRPLLLGHRGARPISQFKSSDIPAENTLAAFEYALAHGCDGFEFDVRFTRDGRQVLCHDAKLRGVDVAAVSFKDLCASGKTRLPCLEDVLQQFGCRAYLDIEIKAPGGEQSVLNALRQFPPACYVVSSFYPDILHSLHELEPSLPLGFICDRREYAPYWRELPVKVFIPNYKLVSQNLVRQVHERGIQIFSWTVNRQSDLRQLAGWGVDGLISDDPKLLKHVFGD